MTPEASAKKKIQKGLAELVARGLKHKLVWNAGASYGVARLDCDGPVEGIPVVVEVKRFDGKGKFTTRQKIDIREHREAGSTVFVIDGEASMQEFLAWCEAQIGRLERQRAMDAAASYYGGM